MSSATFFESVSDTNASCSMRDAWFTDSSLSTRTPFTSTYVLVVLSDFATSIIIVNDILSAARPESLISARRTRNDCSMPAVPAEYQAWRRPESVAPVMIAGAGAGAAAGLTGAAAGFGSAGATGAAGAGVAESTSGAFAAASATTGTGTGAAGCDATTIGFAVGVSIDRSISLTEGFGRIATGTAAFTVALAVDFTIAGATGLAGAGAATPAAAARRAMSWTRSESAEGWAPACAGTAKAKATATRMRGS